MFFTLNGLTVTGFQGASEIVHFEEAAQYNKQIAEKIDFRKTWKFFGEERLMYRLDFLYTFLSRKKYEEEKYNRLFCKKGIF